MGDDPGPETEDVHSSRKNANPCAGLRSIVADYVQTSLRRTKLGWRKTKPSQKHGVRLNACAMLKLTKVFSEFKVSLDVFQGYLS